MRRARPVLFALGVLLTLAGLLWMAQGFGVIRWPSSSFMLGERVWAQYGTASAVAGLLLLLLARRLR